MFALRNVVGLAVLGMLSAAAFEPSASAQNFLPPRGGPQGKPAQLNVSGTVQEIRGNWVKIASDANKVWVVQIQPNAEVQLTGKAAPAAIGPGQYIEFSAEVNKRMARVEEKVTKLSIVTPTQQKPPGAFPDQGFSAAGGEKPGAVGGFGDAPAASPARKNPRAAKEKENESQTQVFDIRGRIVSIKNGSVTLQVPNHYFKPSLKIEIADEPEVDVAMAGIACCAFMQKGDKIQVRGQQMAEATGTANRVEITLVEPLGSHLKKKPEPEEKTLRTPRGRPSAKPETPEKPPEESPEKAAERAAEKSAEKRAEEAADKLGIEPGDHKGGDEQ